MTVSIVTPGPLATAALALQARVQAIFPPEKFTFGWVPARVTRETWKTLTRRTPFIGIGWTDLKHDSTGRLWSGSGRWTVFLATKNASGNAGRYFGDALAPGLFSEVEAAVACLHGMTIKGVGSVEVSSASNMAIEGWDDEDMMLAMLDLEIGTTLAMNDVLTGIAGSTAPASAAAAPTSNDPNDFGLFQTLAINWNFDGTNTVLTNINEIPS